MSWKKVRLFEAGRELEVDLEKDWLEIKGEIKKKKGWHIVFEWSDWDK